MLSCSIRDDDIGKIKLNRPYHGGLIPSYAEDPAELSEIELLFVVDSLLVLYPWVRSYSGAVVISLN
jgi:hypothetical protein